jgi:hypothetical protein
MTPDRETLPPSDVADDRADRAPWRAAATRPRGTAGTPPGDTEADERAEATTGNADEGEEEHGDPRPEVDGGVGGLGPIAEVVREHESEVPLDRPDAAA